MSCDEKIFFVFIFSSTKLCASIADLISTWSVAQTVLEPVPVPLCPCAPRPPVPAALFCESKSRSLGFEGPRFRWEVFVKFKPNLFWSKFWSMMLLWLSVQTVQILSNHQFIIHHSSFIMSCAVVQCDFNHRFYDFSVPCFANGKTPVRVHVVPKRLVLSIVALLTEPQIGES